MKKAVREYLAVGRALCAERLMVIGTCLAGLYFIWQLAKGLR